MRSRPSLERRFCQSCPSACKVGGSIWPQWQQWQQWQQWRVWSIYNYWHWIVEGHWISQLQRICSSMIHGSNRSKRRPGLAAIKVWGKVATEKGGRGGGGISFDSNWSSESGKITQSKSQGKKNSEHVYLFIFPYHRLDGGFSFFKTQPVTEPSPHNRLHTNDFTTIYVGFMLNLC